MKEINFENIHQVFAELNASVQVTETEVSFRYEIKTLELSCEEIKKALSYKFDQYFIITERSTGEFTLDFMRRSVGGYRFINETLHRIKQPK
jgi:hypothetical protein